MNRERAVARQLSTEIDRLLGDTGQTGEPPPAIAKELAACHRLRHWSQRLPPVPDELARRVAAVVQAPAASDRPRIWRSAAWGAAVATLVFMAIWMVVPSGQQVWAQAWRVLLGQTDVELTPTLDPPTRAQRDPLRDLVAVELVMGRTPSLPKVVPEGYDLTEITAVSYPDLPSWISQPFFVELGYGVAGESPGLYLREYRLLFREYGGITGIEAATELVAAHQEVDVSGAPGVLLTFDGDPPKYTVIWERDGLLHELETCRLDADQLLRIAQSVR
jgi:hypothetical protein